MKTKKMKFRLESTCPLLMHNGQMADPMNGITKKLKKISAKRSKTDADFKAMSHLEFLGSLYLNEQKEPVIPAHVISAAIVNGAKAEKLGASFKRAMWCEGNFPLEYEGSKNPETMWESDNFKNIVGVKIGQSRIMRTRVEFIKWAATVIVNYFDELEDEQIISAVERAGVVIGIMDRRPAWGRFEVTSHELLNGK